MDQTERQPSRSFLLGKRVCATLKEAGFLAYFAGGWVRDELLGKESSDIDVATDATSEQVMALFPKTVAVGLAFQSVVVILEGEHFEVSSFRKESGYEDGRHPDAVELCGAEEDAQRRDFTINGMFFDPIEESVYDYVGGKEDLKLGIVRAIGDPAERFWEDRLRMVRGVRLAAKLGFSLDPATWEAIQRYASELFPSVAMERIWQELQKMGEQNGFAQGMEGLYASGLLLEIFPHLKEKESKWILEQLAVVSQMEEGLPTLLALYPLVGAQTQQDVETFGRRLKTSNAHVQLLLNRWKLHKLMEREREEKGSVGDEEWVHFYGCKGAEACLKGAAVECADPGAFLAHHDARRKELNAYVKRVIEKRPVLTASHLMEAGVSAGVQLGKLLEAAATLSIVDRDEDPASLLSKLKQMDLWQQGEGA